VPDEVTGTAVQTEALEDALRQLFVMGALDEDGALTPAGRKMVSRTPLVQLQRWHGQLFEVVIGWSCEATCGILCGLRL
jgi:Helicase associated domain (HA2)